MKRGEVRWYVFSRPEKKAPVLILTRDSALEFLDEVTLAPITLTVRDIPSEVLLTKADGMPRDCAVNFDHLQTVSKGKIGSLVTTLTASKMQQMRPGLLFALGFLVRIIHPLGTSYAECLVR
jgi:mRNA interferase MazF